MKTGFSGSVTSHSRRVKRRPLFFSACAAAKFVGARRCVRPVRRVSAWLAVRSSCDRIRGRGRKATLHVLDSIWPASVHLRVFPGTIGSDDGCCPVETGEKGCSLRENDSSAKRQRQERVCGGTGREVGDLSKMAPLVSGRLDPDWRAATPSFAALLACAPVRRRSPPPRFPFVRASS